MIILYLQAKLILRKKNKIMFKMLFHIKKKCFFKEIKIILLN